MRIIFVGIHNKPGLLPLDSSTKSGKLIDELIQHLPEYYECIKSNFFDLDQLPHRSEINSTYEEHLREWIKRTEYNSANDLPVCLGKLTAKLMTEMPCSLVTRVVCIPHPSSIWSKTGKIDYINRAAFTIKDSVEYWWMGGYKKTIIA